MQNAKTLVKQLYNEKEAAAALGISLPALYAILDEHIFNDGHSRPENVEFAPADLLMLAYWVESSAGENIIAMPRRNC